MNSRALVFLAAAAVFPQGLSAQTTTVSYGMTIAGLPIGSATMAMTPNGAATNVSISGSAGGPLEIGKMSASAVIAANRVTAQSQSGSGKDAASATLSSQGSLASSSFSYSGVTGRGPGRLTMSVAGNRVAALENNVPDNPKAVRVPVADAHKSGIVDPLMLLTQVVKPGGTIRPEGVCGRSHKIFTGVARVDMAGTAPVDGPAVRGMPEGYRSVACRVTTTPVSGHRIDKGNRAEARTASVVFAVNGDKAVLWSLSVPGRFGSFALTAREIK
ncbi:MAG: hypothetical protein ACRCTI_07280 [Beijerinckiaceae bacterium]